MRATVIAFISLSVWVKTIAQTDTTTSLTFSGYGELYYQYDLAQPDDHLRPGFLYNHKRHNEVNLNLALVKAAFASQKTRANLGFMLGNYAQYNLANEPNWAQFVYEANAGVKLSNKHNLWLDAGIIPSHIGFESAIGADCWTLSRSLVAENSPYFEAGAKLSFTSKNEKLNLAALLLNGWQRIHRPEGYNKLALGLQFNYHLSDQLTVNYSNFIGSDKPDDADVRRIYHNLYVGWESGNGIGLIAGIDVGDEEGIGTWWTPTVLLRWELTEKWRMVGRAEYFRDEKQVVVSVPSPDGFEVFGASLNFDFSLTANTLLRFEGRTFKSKSAIFSDKNGDRTDGNFAVGTSFCLRF